MASLRALPRRQLGKNGPQVPRLGLGLMGASGTSYGTGRSEAEHLEFLDEAYKLGEVFWDTADKYGDSEVVLGKWFAANPEKRKEVFLATKFGIKPQPAGSVPPFKIDSTPEYCREAIQKSLDRLGLPYVDLYYVHRLDKITPVEKTMEAMVELQKAGKIKHIGLSECSAESLRRAYAVHPITAVQVEYSPFCTSIELPQIKLLEVARELGVAVVCYSPMGNGFLTGTLRKREHLVEARDSRAALPWLSEENLDKNLAVIDRLTALAESKDMTAAQLSLAWLLAQGDDVFPIPGTKSVHRLAENLESLFKKLTKNDEKAVRNLSQRVAGGRIQERLGFAFADTPSL